MRYSKIVKTYILIISIICIVNFLSLYIFSFITGEAYIFHKYNSWNVSIRTYIINNIQFANLVFIFLSFIILLLCISKGIVNGKKESLSNKYFYIAFVIAVIYIFLYCPFVNWGLGNIASYVIRFCGIIFIIYILVISEVGKYINYNRYEELNINKTDSKKCIFNDIEKIILISVNSICIFCLFLLSSQMLLVYVGFHYSDNVSDFVQKLNTLGPGYYLEIVIVSIFLVILYFLTKGLFLSSLKKIYSYLYLYILFIAADAAFIILFWPKYNPELTTFTWHVVHLIGITYLVIIIFFTNKVDKYVDIKIEKENEYLQITEKEEKSFYIFSIICIFILLFSLIAQFIQMLGIVTYNYFDYPHPFAFLWLIGYIPIIAIFCFSIKFMKICKSDRFKSKIRMCFYFFILFLFIFFPYPYIYVSSLTWIMFDVIGIFIYLYFYIICIKNTVIPQ